MHCNTLTRRRTHGARTHGARYARTSPEGGGGGTPAPAPSPAPDPAPSPDPAPAPASPPPGNQPGQPSGLPDDPAALKAMIADLRKENGDARMIAKQQAADEARTAMAQEIGKALGLIKDDEATDPAKLTEQVTAAQQAQRQTAVELAVYRTAGKHSGDPDALLDSRSFLNAVADLDPAAGDFAAKVDTAIKTAVDTNPKLKAGRAPGASGADHTGGPGEERSSKYRPGMSIADAITADGT